MTGGMGPLGALGDLARRALAVGNRVDAWVGACVRLR